MFHITRTRRAVHFPLETASQKGHWPWRHWRRYRASGPYFSWNQLFLWSINHKKKQKETLLFQANTSSFSSVSRSLRWLTPVDHLERRGSEPHSDVSGPSLASIIFHTSRSPKRNFRKHSSNWRNLKTLDSFSFSSGRKTFNNVISLSFPQT